MISFPPGRGALQLSPFQKIPGHASVFIAVIRPHVRKQSNLTAVVIRTRISEPFPVSSPCERMVRHAQRNFMRFSAITMFSQAVCAMTPTVVGGDGGVIPDDRASAGEAF